MKKILFLIAMFLTASVAKTEDTLKIKSKVKEATVFFSGAEVVHEAAAKLEKGANMLVIRGLSPTIDINSIRIRANNGVLISSFEYLVETVDDDAEIKKLQDTLDKYQANHTKINSLLKININFLNTLQNTVTKSSDRKDASSEDIIKLMEYYESKMKDAEEYALQLKTEENKLSVKLAETNAKINEIKNKSVRDKGALRLSLSSPQAAQCTFSLMYYTPLASWSPYHDINISGLDSPVKITSKAKVAQTTGIFWEQVKLKLSTSRPSSGQTAPLFTAWILHPILNEYIMSSRTEPMQQNVIRASESLADFELSDIPAETMDKHVAVSENSLNVVYDIDLPYSIPNDGKVQHIELKSQEIAAEYKHYCAPKLSPGTFLIAVISNWERLNLLSGEANITYDGAYVGKTGINAASTGDAFSLTLGIDSRVAVKREKVNEMSSTKLLGNDETSEFTYRITVRNNNNKPINMIVKDQYPKSKEKQIEVTLLKNTTPPAFNNKDVGVVSWEEKLNSGESRVYSLSYSVKYPKGTVLNLP